MALLRALWKSKGLWILYLVANAILLGLVWLWLSLPEATAWQLAGSAALALFTVLGGLWLHGITLATFRVPSGAVPVQRTLSRLPALVVWLLLALALCAVALRYVPAARLSWLPQAVVALLFLVLLPLASQVCADGFPGFLRLAAWHPLACWQYYAAALALGLLGAWLPYRLIWWIPSVTGMGSQATSMGVRFALAYVLAASSAFVLLAVVSRLSARHGG